MRKTHIALLIGLILWAITAHAAAAAPASQAWLWLGFIIGVLYNIGNRLQFILTEGGADKTIGGFCQKNWGRLLIRVAVTLYVYRLFMLQGWITSEPIAFSVGASFDNLMESFLDRAKKGGEALTEKIKGTGDGK